MCKCAFAYDCLIVPRVTLCTRRDLNNPISIKKNVTRIISSFRVHQRSGQRTPPSQRCHEGCWAHRHDQRNTCSSLLSPQPADTGEVIPRSCRSTQRHYTHCTTPHDTLAVVSLVRCTLQGNRWPLTRCSYSPKANGPTLHRYSPLPVGHTPHGSRWPCTDLFRQQSSSIRTCSSAISEWCSCCWISSLFNSAVSGGDPVSVS